MAGLLQVKQLIHYLNFTQPLAHARVVIPKPGEPQTLLLIGSDHRAGQSFKMSNTDTMMLVHIDAKSSTINVLSVPRDLKVQLPYGKVMGPASSTRRTRSAAPTCSSRRCTTRSSRG